MDLISFKKRYMPSKKDIKSLKETLSLREPKTKFTENDYTRIAIRNKWAKIKKEDLPMLYRDIATSIIDDINGFCTVEDIEFGDCYFIFKIKELKGWKFGMWFSKSEDNTIKCEWFCQYELWLDKFKPTRSEIHCDTSWRISDYVEFLLFDKNWQNKEHFCWEGYEIYKNIHFMLDNPYLALYRDCFGVNFNLNYVSKRYAKKRVKKEVRATKKRDKTEEKLQQKMKNKVIKELQKKFNNIIHTQVIDMNVDGCICSPRFALEITVKDANPEDIQHFNDIINDMNDIINDTQDKLNREKIFDKYCVYSVVDSDVKLFTITPCGKKPLQE